MAKPTKQVRRTAGRIVLPSGGSAPAGRLIIPVIIQTIRLDPSEPDAIDGPSHLSRPDPSGADQIDAKHQPTDLAVRHAGAGRCRTLRSRSWPDIGVAVDGGAAGAPAWRCRRG
jgi:hypothetical protein